MELEEEIRLRLEEQSTNLGAVVMMANEQHFSLQNQHITSCVIEQRLDLCPAKSNSTPPDGRAPLNTDLAQPSARRKLFDLTKDGGDLIGTILGQKAEEQAPVFSGEPTEYPAWEEAIASTRFCPFRQPIMKLNAIKKSLKGEALEIVKWIGMDQPNPAEFLVEALKREYGRAEIVIRVQEARLDKLEPPSEDDYPSREFSYCCEKLPCHNEGAWVQCRGQPTVHTSVREKTELNLGRALVPEEERRL
uniref:Uncharacterized protein n=2 Tax=Trichuris muris TaxID=70415 RepID=A0A5S6QI71_TRIMR